MPNQLPPEMQARLAQIMAQAQQSGSGASAIQASAQPTPQEGISLPNPTAPTNPVPGPLPTKPPSLMDHLVALRHEVDHLRAEIRANSQVVEAVGRAMGDLHAAFQQTPVPADPGSTYSQNFAQYQQQPLEDF